MKAGILANRPENKGKTIAVSFKYIWPDSESRRQVSMKNDILRTIAFSGILIQLPISGLQQEGVSWKTMVSFEKVKVMLFGLPGGGEDCL